MSFESSSTCDKFYYLRYMSRNGKIKLKKIRRPSSKFTSQYRRVVFCYIFYHAKFFLFWNIIILDFSWVMVFRRLRLKDPCMNAVTYVRQNVQPDVCAICLTKPGVIRYPLNSHLEIVDEAEICIMRDGFPRIYSAGVSSS